VVTSSWWLFVESQFFIEKYLISNVCFSFSIYHRQRTL
jgi:hypothetical protein